MNGDAKPAPANRLDAAWAKFAKRVKDVQSRSKTLMQTVEEKKRNKQMEELRNKISGS